MENLDWATGFSHPSFTVKIVQYLRRGLEKYNHRKREIGTSVPSTIELCQNHDEEFQAYYVFLFVEYVTYFKITYNSNAWFPNKIFDYTHYVSDYKSSYIDKT